MYAYHLRDFAEFCSAVRARVCVGFWAADFPTGLLGDKVGKSDSVVFYE